MTIRQADAQRTAARLCGLYALLLATVYLLAVPPGGYAVMIRWKYRLLAALGGGFLLAEVLALLAARQRVRLSAAGLCLLAYLGLSALSACCSPYGGTLLGNTRREGLVTIGLYTVPTLLVAANLRPGRRLLAAFGAAVSAFCLLGLLQLLGKNPLGLYPQGLDFYDSGTRYIGRYWSTVGNVNLCSAILSLAAGCFTAAAVTGTDARRWWNLAPAGLAVFCIWALDAEAGQAALLAGLWLLPLLVVRTPAQLADYLLSCAALAAATALAKTLRFSAAGLQAAPGGAAAGLALLTAGLAGAGLTLRARPVPARRLRRRLLLAVCLTGLAGLAALYALPSLPAGFLSQAQALLHGHWDDSFGSGRLGIWRQVWQVIRERPLLGGGPDTLALRGLTGFSRYSPALGGTISAEIDAAHNEYLNIWVNQGLFALLAYLAACLLALHQALRSASRVRHIVGAAVLFYLIHAFFGISMCPSAPYFWLAMGVLCHTKTAPDSGAEKGGRS